MKHILIFAGTTEGRELMEKIKHFQVEVFVSVATEYGKECLLKEPEKERTVSTKHGEVQAGNLNIIAGRMKEVEMKRYMEKQAIDLVVDATHPFAREVTKNIRTACREAGIPFLFVEYGFGDVPEAERKIRSFRELPLILSSWQ